MKTAIAVIALALLSAVGVSAQTRQIKVHILPGNSNAASQDMANRLAGLVGASARYSLATSMADILIFADCMPLQYTNGQQFAVACHTSISYTPFLSKGVVLDTPLDGDMSASPAPSEVALDLFNNFVKNSSDEILDAQAAAFKSFLNAAIKYNPQGVQ